jgi:hypothetical protein
MNETIYIVIGAKATFCHRLFIRKDETKLFSVLPRPLLIYIKVTLQSAFKIPFLIFTNCFFNTTVLVYIFFVDLFFFKEIK